MYATAHALLNQNAVFIPMMSVEHCHLLHVTMCSLVELHQRFRGTCCLPYWRISRYSLHTRVHVHKQPQGTRIDIMIEVNFLVQTDSLHQWSYTSSVKPMKEHCDSFGPTPNLTYISQHKYHYLHFSTTIKYTVTHKHSVHLHYEFTGIMHIFYMHYTCYWC
jgi:hypothetical protein